MIDKQTQDQLWKCAQAFRDKTQRFYEHADWDTTFLLENIFDKENLTSDAEPEEVLMVPRLEVQKLYDAYVQTDDVNGYGIDEYQKGYLDALTKLFGDKCLPDGLEHGLEQTSVQVEKSSVQAEPKFQVGQMVRCLNDREVYIVVAKVGKCHYALQGDI